MWRLVSERITGVVVLALGITACILARRLPSQAGFGLGPAFLPFWTGVVLAGCGLWLVAWPGSDDEAKTVGSRGLGRAVIGFSILLLYTLALGSVGYLFSTAGFLTLSILLLDRNRPFRALSLGFGGTLLLIFTFRIWLRVPLPNGPLGW
ncbi:MAG: tripartite tricarboxylate transporter TctB family protein [Candidatus Binatia bacterium]